MKSGQEKFFMCKEDVTSLVFQANIPYKIVFEDEIQYMVRDEQGEINYIPKNLKYANSVHKIGKIMTREEIEEGASNGKE